MNNSQLFRPSYLPWLVGAAAVLYPLVTFIDAKPELTDPYQVFPILGILAWSLMWTHYVNGSITLWFGTKFRSPSYKKVTEYLVLALILLHPSLLVYALWRDTGTLPPASYLDYVGEANAKFILFGTVALLAFLSFEVLQRLRSRPAVMRQWRWVSVSQIVAMTLIFVHGLGLGNTINNSWFQTWWLFMGAVLLPCFWIVLQSDWPRKQDSPS